MKIYKHIASKDDVNIKTEYVYIYIVFRKKTQFFPLEATVHKHSQYVSFKEYLPTASSCS